MTITQRQLGLIEHTLGNKSMCRNYFVAEPGGDYSSDLDSLVRDGFMVVRRSNEFDRYDVYHCTEKAKRVAFQPIGTK